MSVNNADNADLKSLDKKWCSAYYFSTSYPHFFAYLGKAKKQVKFEMVFAKEMAPMLKCFKHWFYKILFVF
jgi:hypothetical protein